MIDTLHEWQKYGYSDSGLFNEHFLSIKKHKNGDKDAILNPRQNESILGPSISGGHG